MIGCAAEMMTSPVISIKHNDTLQETVKVLANNAISGLPVVDDENKVVGIISEKDIIEYSGKLQVLSLIARSSWISPYTEVSDIASFEKGHQLLANTKVKEVMKKKVYAVQIDTPGEDIVILMRKKDINRIPVTNADGLLVGIITRSNIVNYLADNV